ncbi:MAG TPA: hypothetical protein VLV54_05525 [Thermoanaerobaculia bacterium]|nr:hypothetical protein [Thermoanaerobaculia bacterium]
MSGRKYSQVELAAQVREALHCRLAAEQALSAAESLAGTLAETARTVAALESSAQSVEQTLGELRGELTALEETFVEANLMRLDPEAVRARRERVDALRHRLDEVARSCREGFGAAGLQVEAARLVEQSARERSTLRPWLGSEYDDFAADAAATLAETDREIQATGAAASAAPRLRALGERFDELVARAARHQEQDAGRRYIAEALRQICKADLGFAARILPQEAPIDDLVIEVDTFAYGRLEFRLLLDGTIHSESELVETSCPVHFGTIEKRLRSLGVLSNFLYEDDERPVVIEQDAKPAPDGARIQEARRA